MKDKLWTNGSIGARHRNGEFSGMARILLLSCGLKSDAWHRQAWLHTKWAIVNDVLKHCLHGFANGGCRGIAYANEETTTDATQTTMNTTDGQTDGHRITDINENQLCIRSAG